MLFAGQSYYHAWYLSRELRKLGWKADVLNWDPDPSNQIYYHGEDFRLRYSTCVRSSRSTKTQFLPRFAKQAARSLCTKPAECAEWGLKSLPLSPKKHSLR